MSGLRMQISGGIFNFENVSDVGKIISQFIGENMFQ
jgi:hypothetical protein